MDFMEQFISGSYDQYFNLLTLYMPTNGYIDRNRTAQAFGAR